MDGRKSFPSFIMLCIHYRISATSTFSKHKAVCPLKTRSGEVRSRLCFKQGTKISICIHCIEDKHLYTFAHSPVLIL